MMRLEPALKAAGINGGAEVAPNPEIRSATIKATSITSLERAGKEQVSKVTQYLTSSHRGVQRNEGLPPPERDVDRRSSRPQAEGLAEADEQRKEGRPHRADAG